MIRSDFFAAGIESGENFRENLLEVDDYLIQRLVRFLSQKI